MIEALAVACTISALMLYFALDSRRRYMGLPELVPANKRLDEDHVVVIPARNEEKNIQRVVKSFPGSLVLVVDDHSADNTAELARAAGAAVRTAQPLERGWLGKPNACWTGALYTESKWILFVDADTWYEPEFLQALLLRAMREDLVALTVFPRQEYGSLAERMLLPYAFGLYFAGVNPRKVNSSVHSEALANGQCLLVRRDAYEFIQGHRQVAGSVIEDVALAQIFKRHRMPVRVVRGETLAHVRMYDSLASIWSGFEKNSFRFLRINKATGLMVIAASIVMTSWLPVLAWLILLDMPLAAVLFALVPVFAWLPWYGSLTRAFLAPFAIYLFQAIAISGMFKTLFGISSEWKGRKV